MIGSKAMPVDSNEQVIDARDETTRLLTEFLATEGCSVDSLIFAQRDAKSIDAFIELHIEQGPVLDAAKTSIGIVENITGIYRWRAEFIGEANHAGTTPMHLRKDAFKGVFRLSQKFENILQVHGGPDSRFTIGRVTLEPNNVGVVPKKAKFTLDLRASTDERLRTLHELMLAAADGRGGTQPGVSGRRPWISLTHPVLPEIAAVIESASTQRQIAHMRMLSGALHDAATMGEIAPVGMIFVPSINGVSHSPLEETLDKHLEMGANVLLDTITSWLAGVFMSTTKTSFDVRSTAMLSIDLQLYDIERSVGLLSKEPKEIVDAFLKHMQSVVIANVAGFNRRATTGVEVLHTRILSMTSDGRDHSRVTGTRSSHRPI